MEETQLNVAVASFVGVLIYGILTTGTVSRFFRDVVKSARWYTALESVLVERWVTPQFRWAGWVVLLAVKAVLVIVLYLVAPVLWTYLSHVDAHMRKRANELYRKEQEAQRAKKLAEDTFIKNENAIRAVARKKWFAEHPPRLYYKTVAGVTAVLRPSDYEDVQKETTKRRRDGLWEKDSILLPAPGTVVFTTKQGKDLIQSHDEKASMAGKCINFRVAGFVSRLDEIVERHQASLEMRDDIFVPFVNESIISFADQAVAMGLHSTTDEYLIAGQASDKLQPLNISSK